MGQTPEAESDGETTPADVRENLTTLTELLDQTGDSTSTPLQAVLSPANRLAVIDVLLGARGDPRTVSEITEARDLASDIYDHIYFLQDVGIVEEREKRGNARTYTLDWGHPFVQALAMADVALRHGVTPNMVDEAFLGDPAETDDQTAREA